MIRVTGSIAIDPREIVESFVRAAGPGGQNVNKVSTAVELRFDAANSPALSEPVRRRLATLAGRRMTKDGVLVLTAQRHRTQEANRADALDRLVALIRAAAVAPKARIATRPSRGAVQRRLAGKARRADVKRVRRERPDVE